MDECEDPGTLCVTDYDFDEFIHKHGSENKSLELKSDDFMDKVKSNDMDEMVSLLTSESCHVQGLKDIADSQDFEHDSFDDVSELFDNHN
jgi:hypothetical protein